MSTDNLKGAVTFINHDKEFVTITYQQAGRSRTINGSIAAQTQQEWISQQKTRKYHHFNMGDEVSFDIKPIPGRDKPVASNIQFLYNNAYDAIINKALIENRLVGYLKKVNDQYFIKETGSYIFFPLQVSPWEVMPADSALNEPVQFSLIEPKKGSRLNAELFRHRFIPEYLTVLKHFEQKKPMEALVTRVSTHGVYVDLLSDKLAVKIPSQSLPTDQPEKMPGDKALVNVIYVSPFKIIVHLA